MKAKTQKEIKTKSGEILPKGSAVIFRKDVPSRCYVQGLRAEPYQIRVSSAFKTPSVGRLQSWVEDSICESVLGETVEPDGFDAYGSPSWLLAMGLI